MNAHDLDLGSGGPILVSLGAGRGVYPAPAYRNGRVFLSASEDEIHHFAVANGQLSDCPTASGTHRCPNPGATHQDAPDLPQKNFRRASRRSRNFSDQRTMWSEENTSMQLTGNTILITGGGSGIGRGLAKAFHAEGNQVVIAGRRKELLDETVAANPGMKSALLDITDGQAIRSFAEKAIRDFRELNVVIQNAGIMRPELLQQGNVADAEAIVTTNLLGPIRLTAALLPHLLKQRSAAIMTVSSGLAFVPMAITPTYCASKAAIHSYTQSLRYQLKETKIQVLELIPPYVQTELMGPRQAQDPNAMPLKEFISQTMNVLKAAPNATEICVDRVKPLRFAEASGNYDEVFKTFNGRIAAH